MLGTKYRYTFLWYYLGTWLYGDINVWYGIAGTVWGNMIYLCACALALNTLLFHGSAIKRSFFTLWIYGIHEVASAVLFPLFQSIAILNGQEINFDFIMRSVDLASCIASIFMMEILKRKLHLLKRDFEDRDGIYLVCIVTFICVTVSMTAMTFFQVNDWDTEYVCIVAVPHSLIALGGEVLNVCCIIMLERRLVERLAKQQHQMLRQQLETSKEQYEQLIKIRHDMRNHSLCLAQLLTNENIEEARHYLEQWNVSIEEGESVIQTGSIFADALLNPKYRQAKKLGIDISIQMRVPGEEKIAPVDLCCLLANALDNAIEACERMEGGKKWILIRISRQKQILNIEISNSIGQAPKEKDGELISSKENKKRHGYGSKSVRRIVDRHEGEIFYRIQEGLFCVRVTFFDMDLKQETC